jgi:GTP-binding protein Era
MGYCLLPTTKAQKMLMIIGKGGATLKRIATQARGEMERFFQIQVNLKCWVKVKEDWRNREQIMRSFGYN